MASCSEDLMLCEVSPTKFAQLPVAHGKIPQFIAMADRGSTRVFELRPHNDSDAAQEARTASATLPAPDLGGAANMTPCRPRDIGFALYLDMVNFMKQSLCLCVC